LTNDFAPKTCVGLALYFNQRRDTLLINKEVVERPSAGAAIFGGDRFLPFEEQPASRRCVVCLTPGKQRRKLGEEVLEVILTRELRWLQGNERL
jgi:hypothetical protein